MSHRVLPKFSVKITLPTCIHNKESIADKDNALLPPKETDVNIWV